MKFQECGEFLGNVVDIFIDVSRFSGYFWAFCGYLMGISRIPQQ